MFFEKHKDKRHRSRPKIWCENGVRSEAQRNAIWGVTLMLGLLLVSSTAIAAKTVEDEDISRAIDTEMIIDEAVVANDIDIKTQEGIVTLSGSVNNLLAKERATAIAEATVGVRAVVNRITVLPLLTKTDAQLKSSIENALLKDPATESYEVDVVVDSGKAVLSGQVDSWQERELSANVAKSISGITELKNNITVDYKTDRPDFEIEREIVARMKNDVRVDDYLVEVKVDDGEVVLEGTVGSAAEKRQCRNNAWVAGTQSVDTSGLEVKWWARDDMRRESVYTDLTDAEIKEAVKDAFLYDPRVLSFNPDVNVNAGIVTLSGSVNNLQAKRAAERDARNVHGVVSVVNNIKVRTEIAREDDAIAESIENSLLQDPYVERFDVKVNVAAGMVTLEGKVNTSFEKQRAELLTELVPGVTQVFNQIDHTYDWTWQPDSEIKSEVESQLTWSPFVDASDIDIKVENGVVTLTGEVNTMSERQTATENAFEGGAKDVDNELTVTYESYGPYEYGWPMGRYTPIVF